MKTVLKYFQKHVKSMASESAPLEKNITLFAIDDDIRRLEKKVQQIETAGDCGTISEPCFST